MSVSVVEATRRDLDGFAERLPGVAESSLAMAALELAAGLDAARNSLTSKTMAAKELREHMAALRAMLPPVVKDNRLTLIRDDHSRRASATQGGAAA